MWKKLHFHPRPSLDQLNAWRACRLPPNRSPRDLVYSSILISEPRLPYHVCFKKSRMSVGYIHLAINRCKNWTRSPTSPVKQVNEVEAHQTGKNAPRSCRFDNHPIRQPKTRRSDNPPTNLPETLSPFLDVGRKIVRNQQFFYRDLHCTHPERSYANRRRREALLPFRLASNRELPLLLYPLQPVTTPYPPLTLSRLSRSAAIDEMVGIMTSAADIREALHLRRGRKRRNSSRNSETMEFPFPLLCMH